jgi:hypothetical protein
MLDHGGDSLAPHILERDSPTPQIHGEVVLSTDTPSSSAVGKIFKLFSNDLMILLCFSRFLLIFCLNSID